jgi:hypothetical protein
MALSVMYMQMYTMKKESNFSMFEIEEMYPFEMEIFYGLCIKDIKDRIEAKQNAHR